MNEQLPAYPQLPEPKQPRLVAVKIIGGCLLVGCVLLAVAILLVGRSVGEKMVLSDHEPKLLDSHDLYSFEDIGVVARLPGSPYRCYYFGEKPHNAYIGYRLYWTESEQGRMLIYSWKATRQRTYDLNTEAKRMVASYEDMGYQVSNFKASEIQFQGQRSKRLRYRVKYRQQVWEAQALLYQYRGELWQIAIEAPTRGDANPKGVIDRYWSSIRIGSWLKPPLE